MLSGAFPFAVLVLEREPIQAADLPAQFIAWVQDVGVLAAVAIVFALLASRLQHQPEAARASRPRWLTLVFGTACVVAALSYAAWIGLTLPQWLAAAAQTPEEKKAAAALTTATAQGRDDLLTVAGVCAILAAGLPFLLDLRRLRVRRIWALALLSFREAMRRKVYLAFSALLLFFLVADWFLPHKPENQLRTYVQAIYWAMTPMLLVTAALLASFSIPNDIHNQTIHTIVTKPVERFEIILGRFFGYVMLMTLTLAVMTAFSLLYVTIYGVHPDAEFESYRARVPLFGDLHFQSRQADFEGERVGREWEYRKFIAGGPQSSQRAIWAFRELPTRLDERSDVPCEFGFDIFRTKKPDQEGQGVSCTFTLMTRNWDAKRLLAYQADRKKAEETQPPLSPDAIAEQLALEYGIFEYRSKEITDYHTQGFRVPVGLFKNASNGPDKRSSGEKEPLVWVVVKCETQSQFIGVAKRDLYLLDAEGYFGLNFFKGATGLWFCLCLVIGVSVACSTYLSGIIAFICTIFLYLGGVVRSFITELALGRSNAGDGGGGPGEAFLRLVNNQNQVTPLDPTPAVSVATWGDEAFRWFLRGFLNKLLPNVEAFDFTSYVGNGFDVSLTQIAVHFLVLFGYLLPWAVLAYYLMKSREVAS